MVWEELEELLADQLQMLGPVHPGTLVARSNLASYRNQAGDHAGAAEAAEALLTDDLRVLGRNPPDTLVTRSHLATFRGEAGDPSRAAAEFQFLLHSRAIPSARSIRSLTARTSTCCTGVSEQEAMIPK
jgi:hypothetical protein